jgi:hypothetical protein
VFNLAGPVVYAAGRGVRAGLAGELHDVAVVHRRDAVVHDAAGDVHAREHRRGLHVHEHARLADITLRKQWVNAVPGDQITVATTGSRRAPSVTSTADAEGDNLDAGTPQSVVPAGR